MNTSQLIYQNVKRRGYVTGWTPRQLLARQAVKLLEEVCELFLLFNWASPSDPFFDLTHLVISTRNEARRLFDDRTAWRDTGAVDITQAVSEAGDCRVVLAVIEVAAGQVGGGRVSLEAEALVKSGVDVGRGVRVDGTAAEKEV